jgi:putative hydrolase of the HAD superfamily
MLPDVRAVFFDVDDTLVDFASAARAALTTALGPRADYRLWSGLDHYGRFLSGELAFQTMRQLRMADFLRLLGREDEQSRAPEYERARMAALVAGYRLFPDVPACLAAVRGRGLRTGLITNNESEHQRRKLQQVGLSDGFDAVVISEEVGVAKPDAAVFGLACELAGVRPWEAVHVGDRYDADVAGALGAGLAAIWLDRKHERSGNEPVPVITDLGELAGLLG